MAQRNVELNEKLDTFVANMVAGGYYADVSEVVQDALRKLEEEEDAKLTLLRVAVDEGEASGIFEGDAFVSVRREMGWESEH